MNLTGKVAIVTGASRGIGLGIARALLQEGATVVVTGTKQQAIDAALHGLRAEVNGASVEGVRTDVRRYADVQDLINGAVQRHGGLDILVNNAGVGLFRPVADMAVEEWHTIVDTNLTGVFYCCHAAIPHLRARGGGWIINISSLAAKNAFVDGAAYCASKAGLNQFSEALMQEVRHDGIRVSYILPGSVSTDFGGRGRGAAKAGWALHVEDIARVVVDLLAHPSRSLPSRIEIRPARPPKKG